MRLPFVPRQGLCRVCGRDAAGLDGEFLCEDCRRYPPHFDRAACVFRFEGEAREMINAFKFRERLELRNDLVDFLEATVRAHFNVAEIDAVTPIPSTVAHRWLRGYNQCAVLAKALASRLKKPYRECLRRVGHPDRQGGLDEASRRQNVIGTFAPRLKGPPLLASHVSAATPPPTLLASPATILLLDDIMTTGSTLSEAAKTLKEAGARRVWTIAVSRSIRD